MSYCTNCGTQVTSEMLYCPKCGRRLTVPAAGAKEDKGPAASATPALSQEANKQQAAARNEIKKGKLFKEWVKYAGLSVAESPPQKEGRVAKRKNRLFYILIGVGIAACVGLIILLVKIW
ncbi:MAG: zinc ribbon domain-containing protein [Chloroflexi bacterium]|nr:zinc ribbon domain-containing protein [Chloroflexota bacterium]